MIGRLIALALFLGGASLAGVAAYIFVYEDPEPLPQAAAIIVLSGPGAGSPITGETLARVDRGLALLTENAAPRIVMSGGGQHKDDGAPDALSMRDHALANGAAQSQVIEEGRSDSTLQNALFTAALETIEPSAPVIVVTHRYHLPRAWASFRWAGFSDITLVAADSGAPSMTAGLLMEGVKWPVNLVRAAGASLALAVGAEEDQVMPWLR
ncbi:MAG: YdcF family protein [Pseudomonadota bacterium]